MNKSLAKVSDKYLESSQISMEFFCENSQQFPQKIFFIDTWLGSKYSSEYTNTAWKESKNGFFSGPYFPVFSPNTGNYGPEKTLYLDTFHAV